MNEGRGKIAVLCENAGSLIRYTIVCNELGYYSLSLCSSVPQLLKRLKAGETFEYLIYDGFNMSVDAMTLETIAYRFAVGRVIVIADVNSSQRASVVAWARNHEMSLSVLQAPLRVSDLQVLIGREATESYVTSIHAARSNEYLFCDY